MPAALSASASATASSRSAWAARTCPRGGLAGPLDLGCGLGPGQRGLLEGLGGALLGLLAGGLGGLQLLVHLRCRGAGLLGVGLGLLAALRLAGQAAAGVGDLRDRLGLHRLDLRLGRLRVRGGLQLLGGRGELGHQGGRVGQQAGPQLRRAGGGHGDRPVQVRRGRRAPGSPAVQCRAGPERRHRGVRRTRLVVARGRSTSACCRAPRRLPGAGAARTPGRRTPARPGLPLMRWWWCCWSVRSCAHRIIIISYFYWQ